MCKRAGLNWLTANLNRTAPTDIADPDNVKEIAELAVLYAQLREWLLWDEQSSLESIERFLLDFVHSSRLAEYARKMPAHYGAYHMVYLALRAAGHRVADFEVALQVAERSGFPACLEQMPFREIECMFMRWKAGLLRSAPNYNRAYSKTALGRVVNPIYLTNWEFYSVTHTLFYLADWCGPWFASTDQQRSHASDVVSCLLVQAARKRDWDMTGELLLNGLALGVPRLPVFEAAMDALLSAWRGDGSLPGPSFASHHASAAEIFEHCYHTTLVGVLFCSAYERVSRV